MKRIIKAVIIIILSIFTTLAALIGTYALLMLCEKYHINEQINMYMTR